MSVFKQKNAIASAEFKRFTGIDTTAPHREERAALDMVNFRVLLDGSLKKRSGYTPIAICPEIIRASWTGKLGGKEQTFIVYGGKIARIDFDTRSVVNIGSTPKGAGNIKFVYFNSNLYMMNSEFIYLVTENDASIVEGYVPLYGKDWLIATRGEVNEQVNLATRHIRMTYTVNEELIYLIVDHVISNIDAVYINDELITDTSRYYYDQKLKCVCVLNLKLGDHVELFLTISNQSIDTSALYSCKHSAVYSDHSNNTLLLWGGYEKNKILASHTFDKEAYEASKKLYKNLAPLYIPSDAAFVLPEEDRTITAICRHYDRLLIFTDRDAWMTNLLSEKQRPLEPITVNSSHGCTSKQGTVMCGNDPITIGDGEVLRWTADTDELNECNAHSISSQITSMLTSSFFKNAVILLDKEHSEILFSDPNDANGTLWIYNYTLECWYKFDNVGAEAMFIRDGQLGFIRKTAVYLFDNAIGHDQSFDGSTKEITATYESYPTDLLIAGNKKRLCGMTLNANPCKGSIKLEYISEAKKLASASIKSESIYPSSFTRRLTSERFSYVSLRLVCDGEYAPRIYSTSVWAKP